MRACLLSAGPATLPLYDPDLYDFDVIVGVNSAATLHYCDWWSVADSPVFGQHRKQVIGLPAVFTMDATKRHILANYPDWHDRRIVGWREVGREIGIDEKGEFLRDVHWLESKFPRYEWPGVNDVEGGMVRFNFYMWSCTSALLLLKWLGAESIDCWGVDMDGEVDCTGEPTKYRRESRWEGERRLWDLLVDWIGCPVKRHGIQSYEPAS